MREAVSLTFVAGYTCGEAASIMGVKEGTVKSRLNRARAKLKEVMGMAERDMAGSRRTSEFTQQTIERLKREAQRLVAEGNVEGLDGANYEIRYGSSVFGYGGVR